MGRWRRTVSFDTRTISSTRKSPPMLPFCPGALGTGTALPPTLSSKTRGSGEDITARVVFSSAAHAVHVQRASAPLARVCTGEEVCHGNCCTL